MLTQKRTIDSLSKLLNDYDLDLRPPKRIIELFTELINEDYIGPQYTFVESQLQKNMMLDKEKLIELASTLFFLANKLYPELSEEEIAHNVFENPELINVIRIILGNELLYNEVLLLCELELSEMIQMIVFLNYKIMTYKIIGNLKKKFTNV